MSRPPRWFATTIAGDLRGRRATIRVEHERGATLLALMPPTGGRRASRTVTRVSLHHGGPASFRIEAVNAQVLRPREEGEGAAFHAGDAAFDAMFATRTSDARGATELLDPPMREVLVALRPRAFLVRKRKVSAILDGHTIDPDRLGETLRALEHAAARLEDLV